MKTSIIEWYRGIPIYKNNICHTITIKNKTYHFFAEGNTLKQAKKCRIEIDKFHKKILE